MNKCFRVKILDEFCGTAVMQILDEDYYKFGVSGYQLGNISYDHVFTTELGCADMKTINTFSTSLKGLTLHVKILKQPVYDPAYIRCAGVVPNAPNKWIPVQVSEPCD